MSYLPRPRVATCLTASKLTHSGSLPNLVKICASSLYLLNLFTFSRRGHEQVWFAVGSPLLLAVNYVVADKIIFPHVSIDDEIHVDVDSENQSGDNGSPGGAQNWGVALVAGSVAVSMAQLLNTFLRDCAFEFGVH